jgi:hypothetical protein
MTIRSDSYSSTTEVRAYTNHLLDGQSTYNSTTRPTLPNLERFIDRASGLLNVALTGEGLTTPISNSTAKLACSDWVTDWATAFVELTQRGAGWGDDENNRAGGFTKLAGSAKQFAKDNRLGFVRLGVPVAYSLASGLSFTGLDAQSLRSDPTDSTLAQPFFTRHDFDTIGVSNKADEGGDDDE